MFTNMWPTFVPADDITTLKSYDYQTVATAFTEIVQQSGIDFDFAQGGCQQRAHVMTMLLQKKFNIQHCKVWLFAPAALYYNDVRTFFVKDNNNFSEFINWNYHVAPAVLVEENGQQNFYVIDPSINRVKPIFLDGWFNSIGNSEIGRYGFYFNDKYFFNSLYTKSNSITNVFDGTFTYYTPEDKNDLVIEKGLAINDTAMHVYHTYLKAMIDSPATNVQALKELKNIFGNSTALDLLISQNISGSTPETTYRYVITHYSDILLDAKAVFYKRLVHWTKYVNELME